MAWSVRSDENIFLLRFEYFMQTFRKNLVVSDFVDVFVHFLRKDFLPKRGIIYTLSIFHFHRALSLVNSCDIKGQIFHQLVNYLIGHIVFAEGDFGFDLSSQFSDSKWINYLFLEILMIIIEKICTKGFIKCCKYKVSHFLGYKSFIMLL